MPYTQEDRDTEVTVLVNSELLRGSDHLTARHFDEARKHIRIAIGILDSWCNISPDIHKTLSLKIYQLDIRAKLAAKSARQTTV